MIQDLENKRKDLLPILMGLKKAKPWRGSKQKRYFKYARTLHQLSEVMGVRSVLVYYPWLPHQGVCLRFKGGRGIVVIRRFSVITFLHEFAHLFSSNELEVRNWSASMFSQVWPRQFSKLIWDPVSGDYLSQAAYLKVFRSRYLHLCAFLNRVQDFKKS